MKIPCTPGAVARLLLLCSMVPMVSSAKGLRINTSVDDRYFDHRVSRVAEPISGRDLLRAHDCVEKNAENPTPCFDDFTLKQSVFLNKYFGVGVFDERIYVLVTTITEDGSPHPMVSPVVLKESERETTPWSPTARPFISFCSGWALARRVERGDEQSFRQYCRLMNHYAFPRYDYPRPRKSADDAFGIAISDPIP